MKSVVRGVREIAVVIEESNTKKVNYKLAQGYIPGAFKEGGTWCLSFRNGAVPCMATRLTLAWPPNVGHDNARRFFGERWRASAEVTI